MQWYTQLVVYKGYKMISNDQLLNTYAHALREHTPSGEMIQHKVNSHNTHTLVDHSIDHLLPVIIWPWPTPPALFVFAPSLHGASPSTPQTRETHPHLADKDRERRCQYRGVQFSCFGDIPGIFMSSPISHKSLSKQLKVTLVDHKTMIG